MTPRRILFWLHLTAGSVAGIMILVMSVTGVLLVFQRPVIAWVDRAGRSHEPSAGAPRMPLGDLMAKAAATQGAAPTAVTLYAPPDMPVEIAFGRERTVYFDSDTAAELGVGSQRTRAFFQAVENWHRWLAAPDKSRPTGRLITGTCNLAFFFLVVTGAYLWWPRGWSAQRLRAAMTWRWKVEPGRARDWNWHTVTGFWLAAPLAVITLSGVVMSFAWANNLLYRATGNVPPAPPEAAQAANAGASRRAPAVRPEIASIDAARMNDLWVRAQSQVPGWRKITLRIPPNPSAPAVFTIDQGDGGRPDMRSQLSVDTRTGETLRWEPFGSYNLGRRLRMWLRFSHTGEAGGIPGQAIAVAAALGGTLLVYTGLAMAWRRFLARFFRCGAPAASRLRPEPSLETGDAAP